MFGGAPDQHVDENKFHDDDIRRALQRDDIAQANILSRVRLILRRVLRRQNPPQSP